MAGGKIQHWKHGWVPLDAFARNILAGRKHDGDADRTEASARAARYQAHQAHNAAKNAARQKRYELHEQEISKKDDDRRLRWNAAQARRAERRG